MAELAKVKRSRVAEEVLRLLRHTTNIDVIAAETGITKSAVRNILSRHGISLRAKREEREASRWAPPDPEKKKETILPSPRDEEILRVQDEWGLCHLRLAREEGKPLPGEVEVTLRAAGFRVPRRQARRAAKAMLAELRAQATASRSHQVVLCFTTAQERAVEEYLASTGIETGIRFFGARLVSAERGRRKYLVPRAALNAIEAAASADDKDDKEDWN